MKPKTVSMDAATALQMKMAKAEARRAAFLQQKVEIAVKSARVKTESDFNELGQTRTKTSEMNQAELKTALEASLATNAEMTLKIAQLEAEKKALTAKLEESEAKLQANRDDKHEAFYKSPKKAYAWVVGKTVPAFLDTKTASSSVPSAGRTVDAADNHWEML